jgi:hypothetical protein
MRNHDIRNGIESEKVVVVNTYLARTGIITGVTVT